MIDPSKDKRPTCSTYHAFLIRMWRDGSLALWRASARSVQTGEVVRFARLTDLFAYLEAQTSDQQEE